MFRDYAITVMQYLTPKHVLTQFAGFMANNTNQHIKNFLISRFVANYGVNMAEALEEDPLAYPSFNDFFIRPLKPEKRLIASADIVSPVDGIIYELGGIAEGQILQAKGRYYRVGDLLAVNESIANQFLFGKFATLYLSPKDYHRVHMPIDGTLRETIYVPGKLFSVQPATTRLVPNLFARNERLVAFFDTPLGLMALVLVGATLVGAISTQWGGEVRRTNTMVRTVYTDKKPPIQLAKGSEMGYFKLGSTVIVLFANGKDVVWKPELQSKMLIQLGKAML